MIKLRISEWGDYARCNHKALTRRDAGDSESVGGDVMTEARSWNGVEYR